MHFSLIHLLINLDKSSNDIFLFCLRFCNFLVSFCGYFVLVVIGVSFDIGVDIGVSYDIGVSFMFIFGVILGYIAIFSLIGFVSLCPLVSSCSFIITRV